MEITILSFMSHMHAHDARLLFNKLQECYDEQLRKLDKGDSCDLAMARAIATCKYLIEKEKSE